MDPLIALSPQHSRRLSITEGRVGLTDGTQSVNRGPWGERLSIGGTQSLNQAQGRVYGQSLKGENAGRLPKFGFIPPGLDRGINQFVGFVYDRGEGMRYAFEQTLGYTVPRTMQQLFRTRNITGKNNDLAGLEMFVRDTAADFTDTFLGGLVATYAIGSGVDKLGRTYVRQNMGDEALEAYQALTKGAHGQSLSKSGFYKSVSAHLNDYAKQLNPKAHLNPNRLEAMIAQWGPRQSGFSSPDRQKILNGAHEIARALKLPNLDVTLNITHGKKPMKLGVELTNLLNDLWHLHRPNPKAANPARWGEQMGHLLGKTKTLSKLQLIAMGVSLVASLAVPFAIRLMTKKISGVDAFPGSHEIEKYFHLVDETDDTHKKKGFRPFPWLADSIQQGKWGPLAVTAGFFGVIFGAAALRFRSAGLSMLKPKDWLAVYKFDRWFPFTTIPQMELTYGILCATRLAASRNDSEAREAFIRDCMLGWPTLTYFNKAFRGFLSNRFAGGLGKQFNLKHLLIKPNGEIRTSGVVNEMSPFFFENMGVGKGLAKKVAKATQTMQARIAFVAGMASLGLIAFLEPQLAIWLTNNFEMKKIRKRLEAMKEASVAQVEASLQSPEWKAPSNSVKAPAMTGRAAAVVPASIGPVIIQNNVQVLRPTSPELVKAMRFIKPVSHPV